MIHFPPAVPCKFWKLDRFLQVYQELFISLSVTGSFFTVCIHSVIHQLFHTSFQSAIFHSETPDTHSPFLAFTSTNVKLWCKTVFNEVQGPETAVFTVSLYCKRHTHLYTQLCTQLYAQLFTSLYTQLGLLTCLSHCRMDCHHISPDIRGLRGWILTTSIISSPLATARVDYLLFCVKCCKVVVEIDFMNVGRHIHPPLRG